MNRYSKKLLLLVSLLTSSFTVLAAPTITSWKINNIGKVEVTGTGFSSGPYYNQLIFGANGSNPMIAHGDYFMPSGELSFTIPDNAPPGQLQLQVDSEKSALTSNSLVVVTDDTSCVAAGFTASETANTECYFSSNWSNAKGDYLVVGPNADTAQKGVYRLATNSDSSTAVNTVTINGNVIVRYNPATENFGALVVNNISNGADTLTVAKTGSLFIGGWMKVIGQLNNKNTIYVDGYGSIQVQGGLTNSGTLSLATDADNGLGDNGYALHLNYQNDELPAVLDNIKGAGIDVSYKTNGVNSNQGTINNDGLIYTRSTSGVGINMVSGMLSNTANGSITLNAAEGINSENSKIFNWGTMTLNQTYSINQTESSTFHNIKKAGQLTVTNGVSAAFVNGAKATVINAGTITNSYDDFGIQNNGTIENCKSLYTWNGKPAAPVAAVDAGTDKLLSCLTP